MEQHAVVYRSIDKRRKINNTYRHKKTNFLANTFNVYGGSRLPENPNELLKQGWKDKTDSRDKTGKHNEYANLKTRQNVLFHKKDDGNPVRKERVTHYHWKNMNSLNDSDLYLDKYGRRTRKGSHGSHIMPIKGRK